MLCASEYKTYIPIINLIFFFRIFLNTILGASGPSRECVDPPSSAMEVDGEEEDNEEEESRANRTTRAGRSFSSSSSSFSSSSSSSFSSSTSSFAGIISPAGLDLSYLDTTSPLAVAGTKTTGLYATTPTIFNTAAGPKTTGLDDDSNGGLKNPSSNHAANPYTPILPFSSVTTPVPASTLPYSHPTPFINTADLEGELYQLTLTTPSQVAFGLETPPSNFVASKTLDGDLSNGEMTPSPKKPDKREQIQARKKAKIVAKKKNRMKSKPPSSRESDPVLAWNSGVELSVSSIATKVIRKHAESKKALLEQETADQVQAAIERKDLSNVAAIGALERAAPAKAVTTNTSKKQRVLPSTVATSSIGSRVQDRDRSRSCNRKQTRGRSPTPK